MIVSGYFSKPWILVGLSVLLSFVGDIYYTVNFASYSSGDLIDVTWYAGYLLLAFAFVLMRYQSEVAVKSFVRKSVKKKK